MPFTLTHKPFIDENLKSKIDKFFLDNRNREFIQAAKIDDPKIVATTSKKRPLIKIIDNDKRKSTEEMQLNGENKAKKHETSATMCNCCLNIKKPLYEISSCKCILCRECLKVLNNVCGVCGVRFENCQVVHTDRLDLI